MIGKSVATLLSAAGLALGLQACAAKPVVYGPISETIPHGYKDRPNPDGGHTVLVVVPAHSDVAEARGFWERRAKELCPAGVDRSNVFRAEKKEAMSGAPYVYQGFGSSSRITTAFEIEGYVYCKAPSA